MPKKRIVNCHIHGEVPFEYGRGDFIGDKTAVTLFCPECLREEQAHHAKHPDSPYPIQGTSPSVIAHCNKGD